MPRLPAKRILSKKIGTSVRYPTLLQYHGYVCTMYLVSTYWRWYVCTSYDTDGNRRKHGLPSSHPPQQYTSFTYNIQVVLMGRLLPVSAKYQYFSTRYVCATYLFIGVSLYVWYRRKPTGTRFNPLPTKKIHPTPYLFHLQDVLMGRLITVPGSHAPGIHF